MDSERHYRDHRQVPRRAARSHGGIANSQNHPGAILAHDADNINLGVVGQDDDPLRDALSAETAQHLIVCSDTTALEYQHVVGLCQ